MNVLAGPKLLRNWKQLQAKDNDAWFAVWCWIESVRAGQKELAFHQDQKPLVFDAGVSLLKSGQSHQIWIEAHREGNTIFLDDLHTRAGGS